MSLVHTETGGAGVTVNGVSFNVDSYSTASDRLLAVIVNASFSGGGNETVTLSYGAASMTVASDGTNTAHTYYGLNPGPNSALLILDSASIPSGSNTFSLSWGATPVDENYTIFVLDGIDQVNTVKQVEATNDIRAAAALTSISPASVLATDNNGFVLTELCASGAQTITAPTGYTAIDNSWSGTDTARAGYKAATGASENPTWTTASAFAGSAWWVSFAAAAAGGSNGFLNRNYWWFQD